MCVYILQTYSKGQCEQLMREPAKVKPKPGEPKFYDSVMVSLDSIGDFVCSFVVHALCNNCSTCTLYMCRYMSFVPVSQENLLGGGGYDQGVQISRFDLPQDQLSMTKSDIRGGAVGH